MEPVILFRPDFTNEQELDVAKKYLPVVTRRSCCKDQLVICRYSALPYYSELQQDLKFNGCEMINSHIQHRWIANFEYYDELKEFTPETWDDNTFPYANDGKFVVKGRTNSRKHAWQRMMFSENKRDAARIAAELMDDPMISEQGVIYRRFVPLKVLEVGMNGLPFANEYRLFYLGSKRLCCAYYWGIAEEDVINNAKITQEGLDFADKIAKIASKYVNFFVVDVAEKEDGGWILVELNDGQQSGLSCNDPDVFYDNLAEGITVWQKKIE